ncbi:hypothetical protein HDU76_010954 [Blyttiomyces sp. JEL0837]|nr:hypothetical protein HDU76_010954 [Blyttiomyces sp. JEL0837]
MSKSGASDDNDGPNSPDSNGSGTNPTPMPLTVSEVRQYKLLKSLTQNLMKHFDDGLFSDICIVALGHSFKLHRIVLSSNPYFASMLDGPWMEQGKDEVQLFFDDEFVTIEAVRVVLSRIYGSFENTFLSADTVLSLLATANFFNDKPLCDDALQFILSDIRPETVLSYLNFAESHYYGTFSDQILEACVTKLCQEGYDKLRPAFVQLPWRWLQRIVGADCFYTPNEMERYRLVAEAIAFRKSVGRVTAGSGKKSSLSAWVDDDRMDAFNDVVDVLAVKVEDLAVHTRSSSVETLTDENEKTSYVDEEKGLDDQANDDDVIENVYEQILATAILYPHLKFKDLLTLKEENHVPFSVLQKALWTQQELRSRIENSKIDQSELGISYETHVGDDGDDGVHDRLAPFQENGLLDGKTSMIPPEDTDKIDGRKVMDILRGPVGIYSKLVFPPFRFACEFKDVHRLRNGFRIYSPTNYYAGSNWLVYLQKVFGEDGIPKLGIYLQRFRPEDPIPSASEPSTNSTTIGPGNNSMAEDSLSRYIDKRMEVKTWFQIMCFLPGMKKCYILESKPDLFRPTQSWGWRSAKLYKDAIFDTVAGQDTMRCCAVIGHV